MSVVVQLVHFVRRPIGFVAATILVVAKTGFLLDNLKKCDPTSVDVVLNGYMGRGVQFMLSPRPLGFVAWGIPTGGVKGLGEQEPLRLSTNHT